MSVVICLSWWISDLCTRMLALATGSRRPRKLWLLVGGFAINIVLARYHSPAVIAAFLEFGLIDPTPLVTHFFAIDRDLLDPHYLSSLLGMTVPGLVFWVVGNLAFERYCETVSRARAWQPRVTGAAHSDGTADPAATALAAAAPGDSATAEPFATSSPGEMAIPPAPAAAAAAASNAAPRAVTAPRAMAGPHFFQRLSRLTNLEVDELVAVEAEDHYVQVHTTRGKELIYYRFRDALQELEHVPGLQIHRSAWVSRRHVTALDGRGRKLEVVLVTGDRLAVSLSNRGALLQAGLQAH